MLHELLNGPCPSHKHTPVESNGSDYYATSSQYFVAEVFDYYNLHFPADGNKIPKKGEPLREGVKTIYHGNCPFRSET